VLSSAQILALHVNSAPDVIELGERRQCCRRLLKHEISQVVKQVDGLASGQTDFLAGSIYGGGVLGFQRARQPVLRLQVFPQRRPDDTVHVVKYQLHGESFFALYSGVPR